MTRFFFNPAARGITKGTIDLDSDDIRAMLVKTGSSCGSERNVETLSGFTALNRYDASGYVDKTVGNTGTTDVFGSNQVKLTGDDVVWNPLNALSGGEQAIGVVYYKFVTGDADSIPILFSDEGGFPLNGTGNDPVTLDHAANGLALLGSVT